MKKWLIAVGVALALAGMGAAWWLGRPAAAPQPSPTPAAPPPRSHIDTVLGGMSVRQKVASLLVLHLSGTDSTALKTYVDTYQPGGMILMGDNIPSDDDAQLLAETAAIRGDDKQLPRLVATDQEGGVVRRLPGDQYADARVLKTAPVAQTAQAFAARSELVRSVGITLNFGIIADVTDNPASFIYDRVLGTTPQAASERVAAAVNATKGKTLSTIKHFPGHGETTADSHSSIPTTDSSYDTWRVRDAPPFIAGIQAGVDVVMVGHLRYAAVDSEPASLSRRWHDILRTDLGFSGAIVTDAMGMLENSGDPAYSDPVQNAIKAVQAGNTLLLYVMNDPGSPGADTDPNVLIDGIAQAVSAGTISRQRLDEAARLALSLRSTAAGLTP